MVDPLPDLEPYLQTLAETGMRLVYVIDTHTHADHRSGARALAAATGARLVRHRLAEVRKPVYAVEDGDRLELGNVVVEVLHTPGHTPDHLALLITDRRRGEEPWCVLTGHTLMIGDAGRPDLSPEASAWALYHSLQRLAALPDYVEVYPGAFAGST